MRVVLYTSSFQALAVLDMDDWELQALKDHGPVTMMLKRDPMLFSGKDLDRPLLLTISKSGFNLPNGGEIPFVYLGAGDEAAMLAVDFMGAFPEGTAPVRHFRKEVMYRLRALLASLAGRPMVSENLQKDCYPC